MADPSPAPTVEPAAVVDALAELGLLATAVAIVIVTAAVVVFGSMLLRASRYSWPVPIIAPIAMLTLVFGLAGLVTSELVTLAGAGIGALAGVLTAQLGKHRDSPNPDEPDEPE